MAQPASLYRDASGAGEVDSGCDVPAAQEAGGSEQAGGCAPPAEPPLPLDAELERQQQVIKMQQVKPAAPLCWSSTAAAGRNLPPALPAASANTPTAPPAPLPPVQARADIEARTQEILSRGAAYLAGHSLSDFNAEAAAQQKARQHAAAAATYSALFVKAKRSNLTHPELYICHSNCSAAYLALGLHDEALHHAVRCQQLAMASLRRCARRVAEGMPGVCVLCC